jgi:hypothetical protein
MLNENHKNFKHQKPNLKQIPMTETKNSKQAQWSPQDIDIVIGMFRLLKFRIWVLFGIWVLGFGILGTYS